MIDLAQGQTFLLYLKSRKQPPHDAAFATTSCSGDLPIGQADARIRKLDARPPR